MATNQMILDVDLNAEYNSAGNYKSTLVFRISCYSLLRYCGTTSKITGETSASQFPCQDYLVLDARAIFTRK